MRKSKKNTKADIDKYVSWVKPDPRLFNYLEEGFKPNPEVEKDLLQARKDNDVKNNG